MPKDFFARHGGEPETGEEIRAQAGEMFPRQMPDFRGRFLGSEGEGQIGANQLPVRPEKPVREPSESCAKPENDSDGQQGETAAEDAVKKENEAVH